MIGCGGGSAGTGTGEGTLRIQGTVRDPAGTPIEAAVVLIAETGESDVTDKQGEFLIATDVSAQQLTLDISKGDKSARTIITAPTEQGTISIEIKFDDVREIVETSELTVESKIVGACDIYFENFRTIRQANSVPVGLECVLKVVVAAKGMPVPHVPIAIQSRGCSDTASWTTVALGATMSGGNIGVAQIVFPFTDDKRHCLYRVVTPYGEKTVTPAITEIVTLTFQKQ